MCLHIMTPARRSLGNRSEKLVMYRTSIAYSYVTIIILGLSIESDLRAARAEDYWPVAHWAPETRQRILCLQTSEVFGQPNRSFVSSALRNSSMYVGIRVTTAGSTSTSERPRREACLHTQPLRTNRWALRFPQRATRKSSRSTGSNDSNDYAMMVVLTVTYGYVRVLSIRSTITSLLECVPHESMFPKFRS